MRIFRLALSILIGLFLTTQSIAAPEVDERATIASASFNAFMLEDFARLERDSEVYRTTKSRTSSGIWKLTAFYAGLMQVAEAARYSNDIERSFEPLENKAKKWTSKYPGSPSAHIFLSMIHVTHSLVYCFCDGRSGTALQQTRQLGYATLARSNLEQYKAIASKDPRWYETMIQVARSANWPRKEFDDLLREALDREPLFYQTYFAALQYLVQRQSIGVAEAAMELESLADHGVKRTISKEGQSMYARIYWIAAQSLFPLDLFIKTKVSWPRMKESFDDVIARYPDTWNTNNFTKFACLAGDKQKTRELLKNPRSIGSPRAWPEGFQNYCIEWARNGS